MIVFMQLYKRLSHTNESVSNKFFCTLQTFIGMGFLHLRTKMEQMTFDTGTLELVEKEGLYSLTDLWKSNSGDDRNHPSQWLKTSQTKKFVNHINKVYNPHVLKITRGVNGGTFAHWQIALAYAKFLSPELHAKVNQVFKERLEENKDPELGIQRSTKRASESYKKQGKDDKWISGRLLGIVARNDLTDTLSTHDCDGKGIGWCTNEIYRPTIGGSAKEVRKSRGLSKSANIRDNLTQTEIASLFLAESLATDKIKSEELKGNTQCAKACKKSGQEIKKAVDLVLKPQIKG